MKRNIIASICVLLLTSIAPAHAQVVIDLSLITCKQLLEFGCGKADTDQLVDERIFQRDKKPQRARLPLCEAEREGRRKLLQGAQVGYRHERNAKELALA